MVRSIALRTAERSAAAVLAAYDAGTVVRSWPMRGTLHAVPAEDLGWMLALMTARPRAAAERRRGRLGLDEAAVREAGRIAERALPARGLARAGLLAAFAAAGLPTDAGRGYHLIVELAQRGVLCLGPTDGGEQRFVLVDRWITARRDLAGEAALAELALRFMTSHGPATEADLARWSGLPLGQVRTGLAAVRDRLAVAEVDGVRHWSDPALPDLLAAHRAQARAVHLLPGFDELVLGYADRTATVPPGVAERIAPGGNGRLPAHRRAPWRGGGHLDPHPHRGGRDAVRAAAGARRGRGGRRGAGAALTALRGPATREPRHAGRPPASPVPPPERIEITIRDRSAAHAWLAQRCSAVNIWPLCHLVGRACANHGHLVVVVLSRDGPPEREGHHGSSATTTARGPRGRHRRHGTRPRRLLRRHQRQLEQLEHRRRGRRWRQLADHRHHRQDHHHRPGRLVRQRLVRGDEPGVPVPDEHPVRRRRTSSRTSPRRPSSPPPPSTRSPSSRA